MGLDILERHQVVGLRPAQRELTARLLRSGTGRGVELGVPAPGEGWGEGEGEGAGSARDRTGRGAELGAEEERVLKRGIPLASSASLALVALAARVGAACVVRAGPRAELVNEAEEEHHRRVRDMHLEARGRRGGLHLLRLRAGARAGVRLGVRVRDGVRLSLTLTRPHLAKRLR